MTTMGKLGFISWQAGYVSRRVRAMLAALVVGSNPLVGGCQVSDTNEFKLQSSTVTEVFGAGVQRDLARAAARGDVAEIKRLVKEKGADPNAQGKETITPVFWAMFAKNYVGLQGLLEMGGDPNKPMMLAAGPNWPSTERWPLIQAATWQDVKMMEILLKAGANPNIGDNDVSALHRAASSIDGVKLLVSYGADVNKRAKGMSVAGSMLGNLEGIIFLLERGYDQDLDRLMYDVLEYYPSTLPGRKDQQEKILAVLRAKGVKP